jgi:hypothetical protein
VGLIVAVFILVAVPVGYIIIGDWVHTLKAEAKRRRDLERKRNSQRH